MTIVSLTANESTLQPRKLKCVIKHDTLRAFSLRDARQDGRASLTNISSNYINT